MWNDKYELVKSAMSRNGNLSINKSIRWWKLRLFEDCNYNKLKFKVMEYDITNYYIAKRLYDKHDASKGSEQIYVNGIVRNYLRDTHRKEMKMKEIEYSDDLNYDIDKSIPETLYEEREKREIMKRIDTSEGHVFYRVLVGEIAKYDGMSELKLSGGEFKRCLDDYMDKIRLHFNITEC